MGLAEVMGNSETEVLEQIRKEIRYRIEWCACSGVAEDYINLDVHHINDRSLNHLKPFKIGPQNNSQNLSSISKK